MKLTYTSRDGRMTFELEGDTTQELWDQLAGIQEVFEDNVCRAKFKDKIVESDLVRFVVRENKNGDKFYEKVCEDWDKNLVGFKKAFSLKKTPKGTLYPHKMPEDDRIPGLNNWYKYIAPKQEEGKEDKKEEAKAETPF